MSLHHLDPGGCSEQPITPVTAEEVERVRVRVMTSVRIDLENRRLRAALQLAADRIGILASRIRACHEQYGEHGVSMIEMDSFESEARDAGRVMAETPLSTDAPAVRTVQEAES
jgi:hypothetical protein